MKYILFKIIQLISSIWPLKKNKNKEIIISKRRDNFFFGYYDQSPFNPNNSKMICYHRQSNDDMFVDIIIHDLSNDIFEVVERTASWNYQQGAKLGWLNQDVIHYNIFDNKSNSYKTRFYNTKTKNFTSSNLPLQQRFKEKFYLSLDYYSLNKQETEYGYPLKDSINESDTVFQVEIKDFENKKLFHLNDCLKLLKIDKNLINKAHINHISINTNGEYFVFIVRYYIDEKRIDNLLLYDLSKSKIEILYDNSLISHFCWKNESELLIWGKLEQLMGYYLVNLLGKSEIILQTKFDGHPSFIDKDNFITDTYPNMKSIQELMQFDINGENKRLITQVKHPVFYNKENRCDLHPSISNDKLYYQIDFIHKKYRSIKIGKL